MSPFPCTAAQICYREKKKTQDWRIFLSRVCAGLHQLCWPQLQIYFPVNALGKAAPGCGWAGQINALFIPEASAPIGANPESRANPAQTTPRRLNVTGCHPGASPWCDRDVPRARTSPRSRFLPLPALAAVSRFQAPVPHFSSSVAPGASAGDARPARG